MLPNYALFEEIIKVGKYKKMGAEINVFVTLISILKFKLYRFVVGKYACNVDHSGLSLKTEALLTDKA